VAYNMSEWENFAGILKGPKSDIAVLLITFLLTVLVDLVVAIEIGMLLAIFLFMRKMIRFSEVNMLKKDDDNDNGINNFDIPGEVEVFEITGPFFFGAAYKFKDAIKIIEKPPQILLIRMRQVPIIDATGIKTLKEVYRETKNRGIKLILSEVNSEQVISELKSSRLLFAIGKANVTKTFEAAVQRCNNILT
ncbi:MAG TPA: STAS domain-containing protein, partial [Chitinophagaceae bacterium]